MKELMIHVEQIVRPVRAFAPRKLRMRWELLTHLQAAIEEERERDADEIAALGRAKARLGDTAQMTRALQESVPWGERTMMARLPLPAVLERIEMRGTKWWRLDWPMTMMQATLFVFGATILPFLMLMVMAAARRFDREAMARLIVERPLIWTLFNLASIALSITTVLICSRFMIAVATFARPVRPWAAVGYAGAVVLLPLVWMIGRTATSAELFQNVGVGFLLLTSQALIARLVARMRGPYVEWLTLELPA